MVLADRGRCFVQEIAAGIGDLGVGFFNLGFRLFPVVAELLFVRHTPLILGEFRLLGLQLTQHLAAVAVANPTQFGQENTAKRGAAMPPSLCILALKDEVLRERRIKDYFALSTSSWNN